jgi:hypothetical protein
MNNTYKFLSIGGSAKQTIPFGFKSRTVGPKFLYTCKIRVNDTKAEFIGRYLVGRLPDLLVSHDRLRDRKGHYATTFMLVTEDHAQRSVLWQALKHAEAHNLRQQADEAEFLANNQRWELEELKLKKAWELQVGDDLPF